MGVKPDTQDARALVEWDWSSSDHHLRVSLRLPGLIRGEKCDCRLFRGDSKHLCFSPRNHLINVGLETCFQIGNFDGRTTEGEVVSVRGLTDRAVGDVEIK